MLSWLKGEMNLKRYNFLLFIFSAIAVVFIFSQGYEEPKQVNNLKEHGQALSAKEITYYRNSIYSYIGTNKNKILQDFGSPTRVDPSAYDYEWWIYNKDPEQYLQVGVLNDEVVTVFALGDKLNSQPFFIGQSLSELKEVVPISNKVELENEEKFFRFELTDDDLNSIPLVKVGNIYAQLYMDTFTNKLSSIRFIDGKTLLKQRPYELVYTGKLVEEKTKTLAEWARIEEGKTNQIFDMTNVIRMRHGLPIVEWDSKTAEVAYMHSKDMFDQHYFSHTSPIKGGLAERLKEGGVFYKLAGENIAAKYVDAISAVEGWINSEGHRDTLLNKNFTHLGVGVYEKYYTQNFIQSWSP